MGDVVVGAAHEVWDIVRNAVTDPGPWSYVLVALLVVAATAVVVRGKLASPRVLIPMLGVAGYWGWHHFMR